MKKLHLFRLLSFATIMTAAVAFTGCSDDDDDKTEIPTLEVSPATITFGADGGTQTFDITTTGKWAITGAESADWLGITPALTGQGSQKITLTAGADTQSHSVTLTVKVFATILGVEREVGTKTVKVTQNASGDPNAITIPELIAKMPEPMKEQVVLDADNDRTFEAVVVSDVDGGNVNANNLQVMTPGATTAKNGITLYGSGKYTNPRDAEFSFKKGDKVKVTLKKGLARIVNYSGLYEVTGSVADEWIVVEKTGTETITPIEITADKLADYQAMVVTLKDAVAPATAAVWCASDKFGQHTFKVGDTDVTVFIQANMPGLVGQSFVAGAKGDVTGYSTVYQGKGQICPQVPANVSAFLSTAPVITELDPASLAFPAEGNTQTVTVTTANTDDSYTIDASADNAQFTMTVDGKIITVVAPANTTEAPITGVLTIQLMKDGAAVDTKTLNLTQSKPSSGNETEIVVDFSLDASYPADFPKLSAEKKVDPQVFSFSGYDFTFAGSTGAGYYLNYANYAEKTSPYVMVGKQGAYIELPAIDGKALATVTLTTRDGSSKKVTIGIYDSAGVAVGGGDAVLFDQVDGKLEYSYTLMGTAVNTKYRIYIANANNAQFVKLALSYN